MNIKRSLSIERLLAKRNGTSFQGRASVSYARLVELFGPPTTQGDGYKVDAEWIIPTPYGIATIYNYKNGKNYLGSKGLRTEMITEWHIGGKSDLPMIWVNTKILGVDVKIHFT